MSTINKKINLYDLAGYTFGLWDPSVLEHRRAESMDWWDGTFPEEVRCGLITMLQTQYNDFKVRITTGELTPQEKDFAIAQTPTLGFSCRSGKVFLGNLIYLPTSDDTSNLYSLKIPKHHGIFLDIPPGDYDVHGYSIYPNGYAPTKVVNSLPSIVLLISPRSSAFSALTSVPFLAMETNERPSEPRQFLFPSKKNAQRLLPKMNKIIHARVYKSISPPKLLIKEDTKNFHSWPDTYRGYEVILEDMQALQWHDRIKIQTVSFDEEKKIIYAKLIEKLPGDEQ